MNDQTVMIILGIILIAFQVIFVLIKKGREVKIERDITDMKNTLKQLYDWHNKSDDSGRLLWYFPRDWVDTQKEIVEACQQITITQKSIVKILEKMETRIN